MTRKVLYSPGYGAGWVSWCHGSAEQKAFMLEYAPFIAALETPAREATPAEVDAVVSTLIELHSGHKGWTRETAAESFGRRYDMDGVHGDIVAAVPGFVREWARRFPGEDTPYMGGLCNLAICIVSGGPVKVTEYDGFESVKTRADEEEGWL